MVEKVSSTNAYIKQRFAHLPQVEKGEARVIKSGESLWNIAKAEVSKTKKKAKKSEINDYMLLMAKVNGLDTEEKMNKIKANSTIYLPGKEKKNGGVNPQAARTTTPQRMTASTQPARTTNPQRTTANTPPARTTNPQRTTANNQPVRRTGQKPTGQQVVTAAKKLTSSEQSFADRINTIYSDPNVKVESSHLNLLDKAQLYTIYSKRTYANGRVSNSSPVMMVHIDDKGKLESVTYDDNKDIKPAFFDYTVRRNKNGSGKITTHDYVEIGNEPAVGTISAKDLDKLENWVNKNKKE